MGEDPYDYLKDPEEISDCNTGSMPSLFFEEALRRYPTMRKKIAC
jgi:hypothetical protein